MTLLKIVLNFFELALVSLFIGCAIGILASMILKSFRFISTSSIKETLFIFCFGYLAYSLSEMMDMSGIISMLTSGVVMAHYGWYNLSPQGKHVSSVTFQVIGFLAEAFVFAYLGLTFFTYYKYDWSWSFIIIMFLVILVGRFCGTVGLINILTLCSHRPRVTMKQNLFIFFAGLIRGAIAFGLVLNIDSKTTNRSVIVTTTLALVLITTLLFGTLMPLLTRVLLEEKEFQNADSSTTSSQMDDDTEEDSRLDGYPGNPDEDET